MRTLARFLLILFTVVVAVVAVLLLVIAATTGEWTTGDVAGAIVFTVMAGSVAAGAWAWQRALDPARPRRCLTRRQPQPLPPPDERGVVTLYPLKRKTVLVVLGLVVLTALFLSAALVEPAISIVGVLGALFFGSFTVFLAPLLIPRSTYLAIGSGDFVMKSPWGVRHFPWDEVANIRATEIVVRTSNTRTTLRQVVFDVGDAARPRPTLWQRFSHSQIRADRGIPDIYGCDLEELAELMQTRRERYMASRASR